LIQVKNAAVSSSICNGDTAPDEAAGEGRSSATALSRGQQPWMSTALVVENMIGSGVFLSPASLAAMPVPASSDGCSRPRSARLGRHFQKIGGPYAYSRAGFGDVIGFQVAWGYWIAKPKGVNRA
jgi:hypothetical protein